MGDEILVVFQKSSLDLVNAADFGFDSMIDLWVSLL